MLTFPTAPFIQLGESSTKDIVHCPYQPQILIAAAQSASISYHNKSNALRLHCFLVGFDLWLLKEPTKSDD
jgi:hypothetical protein